MPAHRAEAGQCVCVTGNVIADARGRAGGKDQVLPTATRLIATVRAALGDDASESDQLFRTASMSATSLDVLRAEVAVGQQQVASLRAHNLADVAMLQLFQQIGVAKPERVTLTSRFEVTEPKGSAPELLRTAEEANPRLKALRAKRAGVR